VLGSFPEFAAACATEESRGAAMKRVESVCELLSEWGPGAVLLLPLWEPSGGAEVEGAYLENLPEVADRAAELAVKVALEHIGASSYRPKATEVIDLVRRVRHPSLGAYIDIGNAESSGEEPLSVLEEAGDYLFQIHLKGSRNVPFEAMPLDEMSVLLGEIAYDGRAAVEIPARGGNAHLQSALALIRGAGLA
jgi:sugar phosphate isomerase/epimerase